MNPCPCGHHGDSRCHCTDYKVQKYWAKLSGPIMDRIDIQKHLRRLDIFDMQSEEPGPSSKDLRLMVENARNIQQDRYVIFPL